MTFGGTHGGASEQPVGQTHGVGNFIGVVRITAIGVRSHSALETRLIGGNPGSGKSVLCIMCMIERNLLSDANELLSRNFFRSVGQVVRGRAFSLRGASKELLVASSSERIIRFWIT